MFSIQCDKSALCFPKLSGKNINWSSCRLTVFFHGYNCCRKRKRFVHAFFQVTMLIGNTPTLACIKNVKNEKSGFDGLFVH